MLIRLASTAFVAVCSNQEHRKFWSGFSLLLEGTKLSRLVRLHFECTPCSIVCGFACDKSESVNCGHHTSNLIPTRDYLKPSYSQMSLLSGLLQKKMTSPLRVAAFPLLRDFGSTVND